VHAKKKVRHRAASFFQVFARVEIHHPGHEAMSYMRILTQTLIPKMGW